MTEFTLRQTKVDLFQFHERLLAGAAQICLLMRAGIQSSSAMLNSVILFLQFITPLTRHPETSSLITLSLSQALVMISMMNILCTMNLWLT